MHQQRPIDLIAKGFEAFEKNDFKLAEMYWSASPSYMQFDEQLARRVAEKCLKEVADGRQCEFHFMILCALFLDVSHYLEPNRVTALKRVFEWAMAGLDLQPNSAQFFRYAGSSLYWQDRLNESLDYYRRSLAIESEPDLVVRVFLAEADLAFEKGEAARSMTELEIKFDSDRAMQFYNAGVMLGHRAKELEDATEKKHAVDLQLACYGRSLTLYREYFLNGAGTEFNSNPHGYAMCCTNVGVYYNQQADYATALPFIREGLQYGDFYELWGNALQTYSGLDMKDEEADAAKKLLSDWDLEPEVFFPCVQRVTSYLVREQEYQECIEYAKSGIEAYNECSADVQSLPEIRLAYTYIVTDKLAAEKMLGKIDPTSIDLAKAEDLADANPTSPGSLMAAALLAVGKNDLPLAEDYFGQAISIADQQNLTNMSDQARIKRGYFFLYNRNNPKRAMADFTSVEKTGRAGFYTFYYLANCYYALKDPRKCLKECERAESALEKGASEAVLDGIVQSELTDPKNDNLSMAQLYMFKGDSLFDLANYKSAVAAYEISLKFRTHAGVLNNLELARQQL